MWSKILVCCNKYHWRGMEVSSDASVFSHLVITCVLVTLCSSEGGLVVDRLTPYYIPGVITVLVTCPKDGIWYTSTLSVCSNYNGKYFASMRRNLHSFMRYRPFPINRWRAEEQGGSGLTFWLWVASGFHPSKMDGTQKVYEESKS